MQGANVVRRVERYRQIRKLRLAGLGVAWSTELQWDERAPIVFGSNCRIGKHSMVMVSASRSGERVGSLHLGDEVSIGEYNNIRPGECVISIGSKVLFAQFVSVIGSNHLIREDGGVSWHEIDPDRQDVHIGNGCWIGTQSTLLPGVAIGDRCIVGAGAVVTRSFPDGSRLVGVPARSI